MGRVAQRRSSAELEAVYRNRYDHFVRVAAAVIGDGEQGRDAVQAAFAVAIRKRRSFGFRAVGGAALAIAVNGAAAGEAATGAAARRARGCLYER